MTSKYRAVVTVGFVLATCHVAWGGVHTWRINEIYSNADGSIQFIEIKESCGGAGEVNLGGHQLKSNGNSINLSSIAPGTSANKHILAGTANLTTYGGPTPDYIIPANFFSLTGDLIQITGVSSCSVASGSVPTNGTDSLNRPVGCSMGCPTSVAGNSPTNFAGGTGSVVPPACTDGDSDGYGSPGDASCPNGAATDCNDGVSAINPGATEVCNDTIDNDCDSDTDCDDSACAASPFCTPVPSVSQWGLVVIALLMLAAGSVVSRRRGQVVRQ